MTNVALLMAGIVNGAIFASTISLTDDLIELPSLIDCIHGEQSPRLLPSSIDFRVENGSVIFGSGAEWPILCDCYLGYTGQLCERRKRTEKFELAMFVQFFKDFGCCFSAGISALPIKTEGLEAFEEMESNSKRRPSSDSPVITGDVDDL